MSKDKDTRKEVCPVCGTEYSDTHSAIDSILLFHACCDCFRGRNVEGYSQIIAIHNFNRVDRRLSDEECKKRVEDFLNDPERNKRKEWELLGFGCGSSCGSCSSCG